MNVGYDVSYLILVVEYLILFALGLLALLRLRFKSNLKHGWQANFFALLLTGCLGTSAARISSGISGAMLTVPHMCRRRSTSRLVLPATIHHGERVAAPEQGAQHHQPHSDA